MSQEPYEMPEVRSVKVLPDYKLLVTFQNDVAKIFNCKEKMFWHPASVKIHDPANFKTAKVGCGTVIWLDGEVDIDPENLWDDGEIVKDPEPGQEFVRRR